MRGSNLLYSILFCSFSFCVMATNVAMADSTQMNLLRPSSPVPQQGYTMPITDSMPPADQMKAYVNNPNNFCDTSNESRSLCVQRYIVSSSSYPYSLVNGGKIQCPTGYLVVSTMGDSVYLQEDPSQTVYYYSGRSNYYPSDINTAKILISKGYCNGKPYDGNRSNEISSGSVCIEGGCCSDCPWTDAGKNYLKNDYVVQDGYVIYKDYSWVHPRDTTNSGIDKCSPYGASCSGVAWCSRWDWEDYGYTKLVCNLPAGFYNAGAGSTSDTTYIPSTYICGKPKKNWQPP